MLLVLFRVKVLCVLQYFPAHQKILWGNNSVQVFSATAQACCNGINLQREFQLVGTTGTVEKMKTKEISSSSCMLIYL